MSQNHGPNLVTDGLLTCIDMTNPGPKLTNNFSGPDKYYEDRSGNGNHAVRGTAGGYNTSPVFPGYWQNTSSNGSLKFNLDSPATWTISMLLERTGAVTGSLGRLAGTNGVIDRGEIAVYTGTNDVWYNGPATGWVATTIDLELNETAYICFGFNGPAANSFNYTDKAWKNGILADTFTTDTNNSEGSISGYTLGSRSDFNGEWTQCKFYHVTVHDRLLTDNEVAQNFEALRRRVNL